VRSDPVVPADIALNGLPPIPVAVAAKFSELRDTAFTKSAGKLLLIDSTNRLVIGAGRDLEPLQDIHCWLETATHLIDFDGGAGAPDDVWPPLIYREKWRLPKHFREALISAGAVLLWRNSEARELVGSQLVPHAVPVAARAVELFEVFTHGTLAARLEATAQHQMITGLGRLLTSELGQQLTGSEPGGAARSIKGASAGVVPDSNVIAPSRPERDRIKIIDLTPKAKERRGPKLLVG
jgi:hypothetical protein